MLQIMQMNKLLVQGKNKEHKNPGTICVKNDRMLHEKRIMPS